MSSTQFIADSIEQLDLALDQIVLRDRNFDRFALMLIDNAVELVLDRFAHEKNAYNELWAKLRDPIYDQKAIDRALSGRFDGKVSLANSLGLIDSETSNAIRHLHRYRNTAYHQGQRHEQILHSVALMYERVACRLFRAYTPSTFSSSSKDVISHRARKYLGTSFFITDKMYEQAWDRMLQVIDALEDNIIGDLTDDMQAVIEDIASALDFLEANKEESRDEIIVSSQAWEQGLSESCLSFARENGCQATNQFDYIKWLQSNYPWQIRTDPCSKWSARLESLRLESRHCVALDKYCNFMEQTLEFRSAIRNSAGALDAEIQHQIDIARGK